MIAGASGSTGREIVTPDLAPRYALCHDLSALPIPVNLWTVVFTSLHAGDARHWKDILAGVSRIQRSNVSGGVRRFDDAKAYSAVSSSESSSTPWFLGPPHSHSKMPTGQSRMEDGAHDILEELCDKKPKNKRTKSTLDPSLSAGANGGVEANRGGDTERCRWSQEFLEDEELLLVESTSRKLDNALSNEIHAASYGKAAAREASVSLVDETPRHVYEHNYRLHRHGFTSRYDHLVQARHSHVATLQSMGRQTALSLIALFERQVDVKCLAKWISGDIVELFYKSDNSAEEEIRSGVRQAPRLVRATIVNGRCVTRRAHITA
ncbi:hypothetical protein CGC21_13685 [Leishmania donovani]|uniref:Uncharacterized protein n=1 Tax=Leishmania donovani TaxID=5661 RepID=A0A504XTE1_LEIDO|nr:hypothetical protein CGC21_13685 [Leishmania donovani]